MAVFFFQAEDGIRDVAVTGVQTCALPICFAADIEPSRREQVARDRVEIERSILAKPCQQFRMTFSWPQQSDISKLQGEKPIECEKITAEIMIHYKRCGLRIRSKMLVECRRMREMLDDPSEIYTYLSERFDLGSGTEK